MFKTDKNLCESVIEPKVATRVWHDEVFLAPQCKERFLTRSEIPELFEQQIFMAGLADLNLGYRVERQGPEEHTLLMSIGGRGLLTTANQCLDINPDSITVLPAHQPFRFELHPQSQHWKMAWILLSDSAQWQMIASMGQVVIESDVAESIYAALNLLHGDIHGRQSFRTLMLSEVVKLLSGVDSAAREAPLRVMSVFNLVESQLHHDWTVSEIARRAYLSEEQLNRVSKKLYGKTPREYVIALRMNKASDLLKTKEWSVKMIAARLGYRDANNFTHRFTKYFGVSPRRYRQDWQQAQCSFL
ncbi:transcriptional regulator, AraC family [Vibrio xiamenensis]|uniref:Transcriptional regulator, AraC family n=1 Tax=Vibrio xiamenensis TaxID=861298 RepID=A0A1G8GYI3_9VIBR|nr:AraC family transcriptional regulator [Vibrio xiamenensis]SDH99290.1 transcriptional regulator, AraC family [Vibrio xiamenensis]